MSHKRQPKTTDNTKKSKNNENVGKCKRKKMQKGFMFCFDPMVNKPEKKPNHFVNVSNDFAKKQ